MKKLSTIALFCLVSPRLVLAQNYTSTTVKTPTNVTIDAQNFVGTDFNNSEVDYYNSLWTQGWNVQILANSTNTYNCHGYAWHMSDGGSTIWIDDVNQAGNPSNNVRTKYYSGTNSTYIEVPTNYREGLKVSYYPRDHSAVTTSDPNFLISKWAYGPLVRHNVTQTNFYANSQIRYYEVPLAGAEPICTSSSQTFSTLNISAANYSWSGNNLNIAYAGGSGQVVATATGNVGPSTIGVDIYSGYSSTTIKARKNVWLGTPNLTKMVNGIVTGTTPVSAGNSYNLNASSSSPGTSFNYNDYTGSGNLAINIYSPNSPSTGMYVYSNSTSGQRKVKVTASNTCGSYSEDFVFYMYSSFRTYPNPAKESFTVEFASTEEDTYLPDELELLSEKSTKSVRKVNLKEMYQKKAFRDGNKVDFDVQDLPRGIYYLKIKNARQEEGKQVQTVRLALE